MEDLTFRCTRRKLVEIYFSSKFKNIDQKFTDVESFLIEKTCCGENQVCELKKNLKNFKHQLKTKWESAHRTKATFFATQSKWLNESIAFKKYSLPIRVGRPIQNFDACSEQTKRKKTAELRSSASSSELLYAAQMNLRASGQIEVADAIKKTTSSPEFVRKINDYKEPKKLSSREALSMIIEANLSRHQYEIIRSYANDRFPSYKEVQREKKHSYPHNISVAEDKAEVPLQDLLDHTTESIITIQQDVFNCISSTNNELTLISKWGFDGSSGHSQYNQKFHDEAGSQDDKFVFITCLVPLQLLHDNKVYWKNPCPSSPRYCRPLKIVFAKESEELVLREKGYVENQILNLNYTTISKNDKSFNVKHKLILSMIDGKLCNNLSGTTSTLRCYLCKATSKQFNDIDKMIELPIVEDYLSFGISVLHAWIRLFECLLHVAYKLPAKTWRSDQSTEHIIKQNRLRIQNEFRDMAGMIVDVPKPGYGNTNTGNVARRFFQNSDLSSTITGIDKILIERFHVILQCISSGYHLNKEKFNTYCIQTARRFVDLYPWFYMSTTTHKILIHGHEIISSCLLPIGQLSEEALEARNKDFKYFREHYSRKTSRTNTLHDIFNRMLISSDPSISSIRKQNPQIKKSFHEDAVSMFVQPDIDIE